MWSRDTTGPGQVIQHRDVGRAGGDVFRFRDLKFGVVSLEGGSNGSFPKLLFGPASGSYYVQVQLARDTIRE